MPNVNIKPRMSHALIYRLFFKKYLLDVRSLVVTIIPYIPHFQILDVCFSFRIFQTEVAPRLRSFVINNRLRLWIKARRPRPSERARPYGKANILTKPGKVRFSKYEFGGRGIIMKRNKFPSFIHNESTYAEYELFFGFRLLNISDGALC